MLRPLAIVNYVQGPDLPRSETVEVHAGVFHEDEEVLEEELYTLGFRRNRSPVSNRYRTAAPRRGSGRSEPAMTLSSGWAGDAGPRHDV